VTYLDRLQREHQERMQRWEAAAAAYRARRAKPSVKAAEAAAAEAAKAALEAAAAATAEKKAQIVHLQEEIRNLEPRVPTITEVKVAVFNQFGVSLVDLESHRRTGRILWPRNVAIYLCHKLTRHSTPAIGRHFGDRDHTTVLYAERKVALRRAYDPDFDLCLSQLEHRLLARDYNGQRDFARSLDEGYAAIRDRMAAGGPGWTPKPAKRGSRDE
jgi:chromosomal replication initiation ATPase DnaA